MSISKELIYLLCGWSAINGFLLGLYLFFNRSVKKNEANKLLGVVFFLISFKVSYPILFTAGSAPSLIHTLYFQWIIICYMLASSLLNIYTISLLKDIFYFKKSYLLYILPVLLIVFIPDEINGYKVRFNLTQAWVLLFILKSAAEVFLSKFVYKNEKKKHLYLWLFGLIVGLFIIWLTVLTAYYIELVAFFSFVVCVMIYILVEKKGIIHADYSQAKNYKLTIEKEEEQSILSQLDFLMDTEKLYLNTELSLPLLAEKLNVPLYLLSKIINEKLQKNFSEFINSYRIKEAKNRLVDEQYTHLNIAGIAYDCGFNSLSTFNTFFKKYTNTTPSQFKKVQFELNYQEN